MISRTHPSLTVDPARSAHVLPGGFAHLRRLPERSNASQSTDVAAGSAGAWDLAPMIGSAMRVNPTETQRGE